MSKQLESIMKRMPAATPPAQLKVVPQVAADLQTEAHKPETAPALEKPPVAKRIQPKKVEPTSEVAEVIEPERSVQAYVPLSVAKALNMRAAAEDVTVRTLILQGLKAIGFEISDNQVRDRRK